MRDEDPVEAVRSLEAEVEPPNTLEPRILDRLRSDGSIARGIRWRPTLAAAAVIVSVFFAGWFAARDHGTATSASDRYVLFLYGDVAAPGVDLVKEYSAWAREARAAGRQLTGERLDTPTPVPGGVHEPVDNVRGFFVFTATTVADAIAVAQSHPHHRRGGKVVLRRILPT